MPSTALRLSIWPPTERTLRHKSPLDEAVAKVSLTCAGVSYLVHMLRGSIESVASEVVHLIITIEVGFLFVL